MIKRIFFIKIRVRKKVFFFKYKILVGILLFLLLIMIINYFSSIEWKNTAISIRMYQKSISNFNVNDIKNDEERQLYIHNKTEFFKQLRIKFLLSKNIIYDESKLNTFQDKLSWLIIHESPQYKSFLVDKIRLHEYSKIILGKDICVPIYKIYDNINEINFNELPNQFVLKLNHASGMNIVCENKLQLNIKKTLYLLNVWKNMNSGLLTAQYQYIYVKRKIFAEKFLGKDLIEYKVFCFNGKPKFIRIKMHLNIGKKNIKLGNIYNLDWKLTELEPGINQYIRDPSINVKKPKNFKLMIKYAQLLSQEFVIVRVDFYEINNIIYLGELTFSPSNGLVNWKNKKQNILIGQLMDIKKIKNYLYNK